jgi:hypothetical protein
MGYKGVNEIKVAVEGFKAFGENCVKNVLCK